MASASPKSAKPDRNVLSQRLIKKIGALPKRLIAEVEDFVDIVSAGESDKVSDAALSISAPAFAAVWNNPEDDVYDAL